MNAIVDIVHRYLRDPETSWTIGVFGALAEFHREPGQADDIRLDSFGGTVIGQGGALRVALSDQARLAPYEFLTRRRAFWLHGVNICLPTPAAAIGRFIGITEVGPDGDAILDEDRAAILFDLGLGFETMQAMVRTDDPALIQGLRDLQGTDILGASGTRAWEMLLEGQPHRVFRSLLGRIEVHNPIPVPGGSTAPGPHTHILPDLLSARRTHSANVPVPDGFVPVLHFCPPNPILQRDGDSAPRLDRERMTEFSQLLDRYGEAELEAAKRLVRARLAAGESPPDPHGFNRRQRTAVRVALRKLAAMSPGSADIAHWQSIFETQQDDTAVG
ncbi:MAG: hypothetical protein R8L07_01380 [Alphaproteobacteria bacterium]|nr:hypothetical protein [Alphaproteobacteria bacterium]